MTDQTNEPFVCLTAARLIAILQGLPPETPIVVGSPDGGICDIDMVNMGEITDYAQTILILSPSDEIRDDGEAPDIDMLFPAPYSVFPS